MQEQILRSHCLSVHHLGEVVSRAVGGACVGVASRPQHACWVTVHEEKPASSQLPGKSPQRALNGSIDPPLGPLGSKSRLARPASQWPPVSQAVAPPLCNDTPVWVLTCICN